MPIENLSPHELLIPGIDSAPEILGFDVSPRTRVPVDAPLIESIRKLGVAEPVHAVRVGARRVVCNGQFRVRAARLLNLKRIRVHVHDEIPDPVVVTTGPHPPPTLEERITKARKAFAAGLSEKELAVAFGVSVRTMKTWLRT